MGGGPSKLDPSPDLVSLQHVLRREHARLREEQCPLGTVLCPQPGMPERDHLLVVRGISGSPEMQRFIQDFVSAPSNAHMLDHPMEASYPFTVYLITPNFVTLLKTKEGQDLTRGVTALGAICCDPIAAPHALQGMLQRELAMVQEHNAQVTVLLNKCCSDKMPLGTSYRTASSTDLLLQPVEKLNVVSVFKAVYSGISFVANTTSYRQLEGRFSKTPLGDSLNERLRESVAELKRMFVTATPDVRMEVLCQLVQKLKGQTRSKIGGSMDRGEHALEWMLQRGVSFGGGADTPAHYPSSMHWLKLIYWLFFENSGPPSYHYSIAFMLCDTKAWHAKLCEAWAAGGLGAMSAQESTAVHHGAAGVKMSDDDSCSEDPAVKSLRTGPELNALGHLLATALEKAILANEGRLQYLEQQSSTMRDADCLLDPANGGGIHNKRLPKLDKARGPMWTKHYFKYLHMLRHMQQRLRRLPLDLADLSQKTNFFTPSSADRGQLALNCLESVAHQKRLWDQYGWPAEFLKGYKHVFCEVAEWQQQKFVMTPFSVYLPATQPSPSGLGGSCAPYPTPPPGFFHPRPLPTCPEMNLFFDQCPALWPYDRGRRRVDNSYCSVLTHNHAGQQEPHTTKRT